MIERTALSAHVRTLARGPGRSRSLTETEAEDAMRIILSGKAPPEAIGALMMLMRFRGESPEEIAGFIRAIHEHLPPWMADLQNDQNKPDLDWPSYAAGRTRGLPYFLLAALLLSQNGVKIFMHGFNSHHSATGSTEQALNILGLKVSTTEAEVKQSLSQYNFAYMPLRSLSQPLYDLINLRDVLGLRSPINTVLRSLNPVHARAAVIGVFHPPYISLQVGATLLMKNGDAIIFKGGGGEAERTPIKDVRMTYTKSGEIKEQVFKALMERGATEETDQTLTLENFAGLWSGEIRNEQAVASVIATAATALFILGKAETIEDAEQQARDFWQTRKVSSMCAG